MFRKDAPVSQAQRSIHNVPSGASGFALADAAVAKLAPGRYALPRTTPDGSGNMVNFFKVFEARNRQGVKGNRIVMLIAKGGGDYSEIRLSVGHQIAAATHIAEDPMAAMVLYGRETATCGRCGRALSNDASRAAGIGPECAKK
jgi:Family of unknown function (DUF6011)